MDVLSLPRPQYQPSKFVNLYARLSTKIEQRQQVKAIKGGICSLRFVWQSRYGN